MDPKFLRFYESGARLHPMRTVEGGDELTTVSTYGLEDGAQIEAEVEQYGGFSTH